MTTATAKDVLAGGARWSVERADALEFVAGLPDDSINLLFTSPPYEKAREYGDVKFNLAGEDWVAWMVRLVRLVSPKVTGLIAINCEGQTKDYSYSAVPFLLIADLKRAGFNLRKPPAYERNGIMGSGGPDWLRNDWEPVVCITRPGRLPWSAPTACGEPPKWEMGGPPSHRSFSGERVNAQTTTRRNRDRVEPQVAAAIAGELELTVGTRLVRHPQKNVTMRTKLYRPPEIANPGNVIHCTVGGGNLGHPASHHNEAPFPISLPLFFVKSFCPPGGVVLDPFAGSGTTLDAAVQCGRRAIGCDLRDSQVELTRRRMRTVTPCLPGVTT